MGIRISAAIGLLLPVLGTVFLTCELPPDPNRASNARVELFLKTSTGTISDTSITDTVGNIDTIGVVHYLTQHITLTKIEVMAGNVREYLFECTTKTGRVDTVYYPVSFTTAGDRSVTAIGTINGQPDSRAIATIRVVDRPVVNRKPVLSVSGTKSAIAGETITLPASAVDIDEGQIVTIEALQLPENALFAANIITWITTIADTGTHTAVLIARDNGLPVMADTDTVVITVSSRPDSDTTGPVITRVTPAKDSVNTNASNFTVTLSCTDASGVASVSATLGTQSFNGTRGDAATWSISVSGLLANVVSRVVFTATDSSRKANSATLTIYMKYDPTMEDSAGPTIIRTGGPASGAVIKTPIITITDSIVDPSGLDSAYWTLNGTWAGALAAVAGSSNDYRLLDTLTTYHANRIVIHAIDNATRRNRDSAVITLDFNIPPSISDTGIATDKNNSVSFTLPAVSPDGDPVAWTIAGDPFNGTVTGTLPSLTYAPAANFSGVDSFFVTVSDGVWSDTGKVRIVTRNVNFPPVLRDSSVTIDEDTPVTLTLSGTDPDGDPISGWTILKQGSNGTAAFASPPENRVTYSPSVNFAGRDTFSFRAGDGTLSDTGYVWITVTTVNDPPSVSRNLGLTVLEGGEGTVGASRLDFSDPDNATGDLTITLSAITKNGQLTLSGVPIAAAGTLTYDDLSSGNLRYMHNGSETAADSFSFAVSDGQTPRTGTFRFTISPINDLPTLSKTGSQMQSVIGTGNYYRDTVVITDPEAAYATMNVTMVPADAGFTFTTTNGRVVINWLVDFNRYSFNQAVPCSLKIVDGATTISVGWTTTVGRHVWTKIFNGADVENYITTPDWHLAPRDSFLIFTGHAEGTSTANIYRCTLTGTPAWTLMGSIPIGLTLTTVVCNGPRLLVGSGLGGNLNTFNAATFAKTTDSARGLNYWSHVFLSDGGNYFYTTRSAINIMAQTDSNYLYQNGTKVYSRDTSGQREVYYGAASPTHIFFSTSRTTGSGIVLTSIARLTNPLPNTASYVEYPSSSSLYEGGHFRIYTDKNNADTIYTYYSGQIKRLVNFPTSTTPGVQNITITPTPTEIATVYSGSVGWYFAGTTLYFTRDGFASATTETFDAGFVPKMVFVAGDKKAIFVIGTDKTIYRY